MLILQNIKRKGLFQDIWRIQKNIFNLNYSVCSRFKKIMAAVLLKGEQPVGRYCHSLDMFMNTGSQETWNTTFNVILKDRSHYYLNSLVYLFWKDLANFSELKKKDIF